MSVLATIACKGACNCSLLARNSVLPEATKAVVCSLLLIGVVRHLVCGCRSLSRLDPICWARTAACAKADGRHRTATSHKRTLARSLACCWCVQISEITRKRRIRKALPVCCCWPAYCIVCSTFPPPLPGATNWLHGSLGAATNANEKGGKHKRGSQVFCVWRVTTKA